LRPRAASTNLFNAPEHSHATKRPATPDRLRPAKIHERSRGSAISAPADWKTRPRKLDELMLMLDTFKVMFEVVEPTPGGQ
jgi:hypothetical protein